MAVQDIRQRQGHGPLLPPDILPAWSLLVDESRKPLTGDDAQDKRQCGNAANALLAYAESKAKPITQRAEREKPAQAKAKRLQRIAEPHLREVLRRKPTRAQEHAYLAERHARDLGGMSLDAYQKALKRSG
jgi:hypothetical protein